MSLAETIAEALQEHGKCTRTVHNGKIGERWTCGAMNTGQSWREHMADVIVERLGIERIGDVVDWGGGYVRVFVDRDLKEYPANAPLFRIAALESLSVERER